MAENLLLSEIAERLRANKPVPKVTTREFLVWFSAQRRGQAIVARIREALDTAGLETEPDFESAYIDANIEFAIRTEIRDRPISTDLPDPTIRISRLEPANVSPVSVSPDAGIQIATTAMLKHDFSQLPVMTGEYSLKGIISWTTIGQRLAVGMNATRVSDLMDSNANVISADSSLFDAIPGIIQYDYVLVRARDNKISGIITASDLSLQFRQLTEPFLLLGEIENHIRRILNGHFSEAELDEAKDPSDADREVKRVSDLTFGEYIRLLEKPQNWGRLNLKIDRSDFCEPLNEIRRIRNDVMHFDPDGIAEGDLCQLQQYSKFLQRLHRLGVT